MLVVNSWEGVSLHAKRVGAKFPELVASQWALESGFGKHVSGKHNYFGLKGIWQFS
jgi:flagellum-specific peptidoglycan hydrolase FlgJ